MSRKNLARHVARLLIASWVYGALCWSGNAWAENTYRYTNGAPGYPDGSAVPEYPPGVPSAEAMLIDGLIVRPASLVGTVVGTGVFLITLPFSALSGNVSEAGSRLIAEPAAYTFTRCFGCIGYKYWPY